MDDNSKGIAIALFGAAVIVPDTLFMRLSGLGPVQMVAWRGCLCALVLISVWAWRSADRRGDLGRLATRGGLAAMAVQAVNAGLFAWGIGHAPVAVVLFAIATVPVWAALMGALVLSDRVRAPTLVASLLVLAGIGLSVTGGGGAEGTGGSGDPLIGALCGLAVAFALASSFTIYRARPDLPVALTVGCGAGLAGLVGWWIAPPLWQTDGWLPAIWVTGAVILPISFTALSVASRYTLAANVSLVLLLETVLGPIAVWMGLGEAVDARGLIGGAVVVATLAVYLWDQRRRTMAKVYSVPAPR